MLGSSVPARTQKQIYPQLKKKKYLFVLPPEHEFSFVLSPSAVSMNKTGILGLYISSETQKLFAYI